MAHRELGRLAIRQAHLRHKDQTGAILYRAQPAVAAAHLPLVEVAPQIKAVTAVTELHQPLADHLLPMPAVAVAQLHFLMAVRELVALEAVVTAEKAIHPLLAQME